MAVPAGAQQAEMVANGTLFRDYDFPEISNALLTTAYRDALTKAITSLRLARRSITDGRAPDLIAVDVQDALDHVGEVTGAVTNEEVLDSIFSEFCIGK